MVVKSEDKTCLWRVKCVINVYICEHFLQLHVDQMFDIVHAQDEETEILNCFAVDNKFFQLRAILPKQILDHPD